MSRLLYLICRIFHAEAEQFEESGLALNQLGSLGIIQSLDDSTEEVETCHEEVLVGESNVGLLTAAMDCSRFWWMMLRNA